MQRLLFILSVGLIITQACQTTSRCKDRKEVTINAGFYQFANGIETDTVLSNPVIYGIGREDSVLTAGISSLSSVNLPPLPGVTSCAFAFDYGGLSDTLFFNYTPELELKSIECGFIEIYRNLEVNTTHNIIDSIRIIQPLVTDLDEENIRIYIH